MVKWQGTDYNTGLSGRFKQTFGSFNTRDFKILNFRTVWCYSGHFAKIWSFIINIGICITAPFPKNPQSPVPFRRLVHVPYKHTLTVAYNGPL